MKTQETEPTTEINKSQTIDVSDVNDFRLHC